jgi:hypothetical protein
LEQQLIEYGIGVSSRHSDVEGRSWRSSFNSSLLENEALEEVEEVESRIETPVAA